MITTDRKPATDNTLKHSWGLRFQAAREAMNMSEKDAASRLHLKPHIINIIETERFAEGPPVIFMRGYIRSYGRLLNLPEKDLTQALAQFDFGSPTTPPVSTHMRMRENNSNSSSIWSTAFVVLVLTGLVGVWWWNSHVRNAPVVDVATATAPAAEVSTVAAATPAAANPAEAQLPAQLNTALANTAPPTAPIKPATPAPIVAAPAAGATVAQTTTPAVNTPAPADTTVAEQQSTTPTEQQVAAAPEPAAVANNTVAPTTPEHTTAPITEANAAPADSASAEDTTDEPATPAKTHSTKYKLPNLADSEMSVPEEGLDNEPSE